MKQETTLLDAINNSLENPTEKPDEPTQDDTPVLETDASAEGTTPNEEAGGAPAGDGSAMDGTDETAAAGSDPDQPAGGEAPEKGDSAAAKKADEKNPDEKKPDDKKALDPVNDPIPANMHARTKERITSLVGMVKDQAKTIETQQGLFTAVQETGVTAENFAKTLAFLRHYNSPNATDREAAYNFLVGELRALSTQLGKKMPGGDELEGHQDLLDAVAAQSITREYAEELARNRNRANLETQTARQRADADTAWNTSRDEAAAQLNELGKTLKALDDAVYDRVAALVVPKMQEFAKTAHPSKWTGEFQRLYTEARKTLPAQTPTQPQTPAQKPAGQQPLRANKQPSGEGKKQPGSLLEAVNAAIR